MNLKINIYKNTKYPSVEIESCKTTIDLGFLDHNDIDKLVEILKQAIKELTNLEVS